MSRAELIRRVWRDDTRGTRAVRENNLVVYVCSLRKRLRSIGLGSALATVRGFGYQLG